MHQIFSRLYQNTVVGCIQQAIDRTRVNLWRPINGGDFLFGSLAAFRRRCPCYSVRSHEPRVGSTSCFQFRTRVNSLLTLRFLRS